MFSAPACTVTDQQQVISLCRKYKKSLKGLSSAKQAYDSLTAAANSHIIMEWSAVEKDAQAGHTEDISSMDFFDVHLKQGNPSSRNVIASL